MNAENLNDKIKLHEAAVSMFHDRAAMDESGRENRAPGMTTDSECGSVTHIPSTPGVHLTPDAERRIFNYNFRGPIPSQHRCQRSLFGKTMEVEITETPKKKPSSFQTRTPLRSQSRELFTSTPVRKLHPLSQFQLHNDTVDEIAEIDAVLASVTPPCRSLSSIPSPRSINLTPRTDYSRSQKKPCNEQKTHVTSTSNDTPNVQPKHAAVAVRFIPGVKTSLTREKLIQNFKEALELNIKAKNRYCKYEKEYLLKIGESRKVEMIEAKMNKLDGIRFEAIKGVEAMTTEWTTVCFLLSREA